MKKILYGLFILILLGTLVYFTFGKENIGFFFDRIGLTENSYRIEVDKNVNEDSLYIYWVAEEVTGNRTSNLLLYNNGVGYFDIPLCYGKNGIYIEYKNHLYNRIGILKTSGYSKHNYTFKFKEKDNKLIIDWKINNWYNTDLNLYQGVDTLTILN